MRPRLVLLFIFLIIVYRIWLEKTSYERFTPLINTSPPQTIGVVTYNIQYLPWKSKDFQVLRQQIRMYPIILLQEVFNRWSSLPIPDAFPEYYIARGRMKSLNFVNSGLVTLSRYPIVSQEFIEYDHYTPFSADAFSNKGFLACVIQLPIGNVCFINTHTQSCEYADYDPTVKLQLRQLFQYANSLPIPFVIGGDFNIDYRELTPDMYSPARIEAPPEPTIYINLETGYTSTVAKNGFRPYVLDYFVVHPSIASLQAETEQNSFSDHNPVFLLLSQN